VLLRFPHEKSSEGRNIALYQINLLTRRLIRNRNLFALPIFDLKRRGKYEAAYKDA
jgi:hypothetical protein